MSEPIKKALELLFQLPEKERNEFANFIVDEINSEKVWEEIFSSISPEEFLVMESNVKKEKKISYKELKK